MTEPITIGPELEPSAAPCEIGNLVKVASVVAPEGKGKDAALTACVAGKFETETEEPVTETVPETGCVAGKLLTETVPDTGCVTGKFETETEPDTGCVTALPSTFKATIEPTPWMVTTSADGLPAAPNAG